MRCTVHPGWAVAGKPPASSANPTTRHNPSFMPAAALQAGCLWQGAAAQFGPSACFSAWQGAERGGSRAGAAEELLCHAALRLDPAVHSFCSMKRRRVGSEVGHGDPLIAQAAGSGGYTRPKNLQG